MQRYHYFFCHFFLTFISLSALQQQKKQSAYPLIGGPSSPLCPSSLKQTAGFSVCYQSFSLLPILLTPFVASIPDLFLALHSAFSSSTLLLPLVCSLDFTLLSLFTYLFFKSPNLPSPLFLFTLLASPQSSSSLWLLTRPAAQRCTRWVFFRVARWLLKTLVKREEKMGKRSERWAESCQGKRELKSRNIRWFGSERHQGVKWWKGLHLLQQHLCSVSQKEVNVTVIQSYVQYN